VSLVRVPRVLCVALPVCAVYAGRSGACVYGGKSGIHTSVSVSYRDLLKLGLNHCRGGGGRGDVWRNVKSVSAVSRCFLGIGCLKFEYLSLFKFHVCFPCELQVG